MGGRKSPRRHSLSVRETAKAADSRGRGHLGKRAANSEPLGQPQCTVAAYRVIYGVVVVDFGPNSLVASAITLESSALSDTRSLMPQSPSSLSATSRSAAGIVTL